MVTLCDSITFNYRRLHRVQEQLSRYITKSVTKAPRSFLSLMEQWQHFRINSMDLPLSVPSCGGFFQLTRWAISPLLVQKRVLLIRSPAIWERSAQA